MTEKKEYIEREATLRNLADDLPYKGSVKRVLMQAPAADVVEVKHGEWVFEHDPIKDPKKYFIRIVCSCCGLKTGEVSNYCPKCGAKMDGERKEK